jgi:hypothetical protein
MIGRILAGLVALVMGVSALNWVADPASAAQGLGMPLLDGIGRSTQVGDFTAFFSAVTIFCVLGVVTQRAHWLHSAATILGLAALARTLAWALHGAEFATVFIVMEMVMTTLLLVAAVLFTRTAATS